VSGIGERHGFGEVLDRDRLTVQDLRDALCDEVAGLGERRRGHVGGCRHDPAEQPEAAHLFGVVDDRACEQGMVRAEGSV
jgi:hypothetical protein